MKANWDDPAVVERLLSALERIAEALEFASGLQRPVEEPVERSGEREGPFSAVSYLDDAEEFEKEQRKEAYERRTGRRLGPEEDVPRPAAAKWTRPGAGEEPLEDDQG